MCAGNIIGKSHNYQDFRKMGNMTSINLLDFFVIILSLSSLASLPFFIGFFNKHYLLLLLNNSFFFLIPSVFILLASITGIFYSLKLLNGVF